MKEDGFACYLMHLILRHHKFVLLNLNKKCEFSHLTMETEHKCEVSMI